MEDRNGLDSEINKDTTAIKQFTDRMGTNRPFVGFAPNWGPI